MRQYAWLNFHGGCWHLLTDNARDRRKWVNRQLALSDLVSEGWTIGGTSVKVPRANHDADRHLYGYSLIRTVH